MPQRKEPIENKQDRPGTTPKRGKSAVDERQLDLWSAPRPEAPAPSASTPAPPVGEALQVPEKKAPVVTRAVAPAKPLAAAVAGPRSGTSALSATNAAVRPALTRRQHTLLDYLRERSERGQHPPSLTEICHDLGLVSRGSLHKQIVALVEAGLVEPMHGKQRGVRLQRASNDDVSIPLLGAIAAGRPIEALVREETLALPPWLLRGSPCYALRVRGDSMRDAGILDGDVVVIEPRDHARNGETVVALIDEHEATLKRIEQRRDEVVLHAENPDFPPQRYTPGRVRIQGVVIAQVRRY